MLTVKTIKTEFNNAKSYGYVYGYIVRTVTFSVYIELGKEQEYMLQPSDDKNTKFKMFTHSTVYVAETDEELDKRNYIQRIPNIKVRIFC